MDNVTNIAELQEERSEQRRFPKDLLSLAPNMKFMDSCPKVQNSFPIDVKKLREYTIKIKKSGKPIKEYLKNSVVRKGG